MACWAQGRPAPEAAVPGGDQPAGAFVSLYRHGALRGCIGHIEADQPLAEVVAEMAVAAAKDDPRFPPVRLDELDDLDVELSILSPFHKVRADEIVPGRDGVLVHCGTRRGVFLPQVATEYGWDRETLLTMVCKKAGLDGGAWRSDAVELFAFEAQVVTAADA